MNMPIDAVAHTVSEPLLGDDGPVSPWWVRILVLVMVVGFALLVMITTLAYRNAPPIPGKVLDAQGSTLFTRTDIGDGQAVMLRYGLMDNGSIWGHGAYLGPDYSALALHMIGMDVSEALALQRYGKPSSELDAGLRAALQAETAVILKTNRYDAGSDTLRLTAAESAAYRKQITHWAGYFKLSAENGGLKPNLITDPAQIRQFTAFVTWTAWASVANRPGRNFSYTNNFPYDPSVGNVATGGAVLWSALSLVILLAGIAAVLLIFGRLENLGWINHGHHVHPQVLPGAASPGQRALVKFYVVVTALFLMQTLVGGAIAHSRAEPGDFYGFPLDSIFPTNLLRTWHLQTAVLWIATAYVAAALFLGRTLRRDEPRSFAMWVHLLFGAFAVVIVGSLLGEWAGISQLLGGWWYWLGNQGWEYLELGRIWQVLLVIGLFAWFAMLWTLVRPRVVAPPARPLAVMFLVAALAVPVFYVPALFIGSHDNFTVVDTWRFWIIHLWLEGFFELFATTVVALTFYQLGLTRRNTALRIIYLDAILYFLGGLVGTGHHWYFSGQTQINMALAGLFSVLEVVPLTLLTLDAWAFVRTTRGECAECGTSINIPHKWTFYFLMAVGFWNFVGAGVFGFLINLPIVSYYETGTILTPNHGHAALMGVFGMLAIALMAFVLRQSIDDARWPAVEKYIKVAFFGTNGGLVLMLVLSLFPGGVWQMWDVIENGYWHARSPAFTGGTVAKTLEWMRLPGDLVFIVFGALPLLIAAVKGWRIVHADGRRLTTSPL